MDDLTFQGQLHELKKKIEELANRHPPSPQPPRNQFLPNFTAQMEDIKHRLRQLDTNTRATLQQHQSPDPHEHAAFRTSTQPPSLQNLSWFSHNDRLSLPSGPLFWQLFNSLRSDVRNVEGRVTTLEQEVSDLEDKVAGWSPERLTPATTVASCDRGSDPSFPEILDPTWNLDFPPDVKPADPPFSVNTNAVPAGLEPVPSPSRVIPPILGEAFPRDEIVQSLLKAKLDAAHLSIEMLRKFNAALDGGVDQLGSEASKTLRSLLKFHEKFTENTLLDDMPIDDGQALPEPLSTLTDGAPNASRTSTPTQNVISAPARNPTGEHVELASATDDMVRLNRLLNHTNNSYMTSAQSPEGVAFRDKELSRMDELLRNAQEAARISEQQLQERDAELAKFQNERAASERQYEALLEELKTMRDEKQEREEHVQMLELVLQKRSADLREWQTKYNRLHECYVERGALLTTRRETTTRLEEALQLSHCQRDDAADDVQRLRSFCEQKDQLLASQEQIIARGGKLLQQKDEDIEAFSRKVKSLEDDLDYERRHKSRIAKLLDEKEENIKELTSELLTAKTDAHKADAEVKTDSPSEIRTPKVGWIVSDEMSKDDSESNTRNDSDHASLFRDSFPPRPQTPHPAHEASLQEEQQPVESEKYDTFQPLSPSPFFRFTGENDASPPVWSPSPLRENTRLPGEQRRAAVWGAADDSRPVFGEPSNLGYPHHRGNSTSHKRSHERGHEFVPVQDARTEAHRRRLMRVSSFTSPTGPCRMQSMAELRSPRHEGERRHDLSRHHSMRELRRPELQAYVETESDSGDEVNETE